MPGRERLKRQLRALTPAQRADHQEADLLKDHGSEPKRSKPSFPNSCILGRANNSSRWRKAH